MKSIGFNLNCREDMALTAQPLPVLDLIVFFLIINVSVQKFDSDNGSSIKPKTSDGKALTHPGTIETKLSQDNDDDYGVSEATVIAGHDDVDEEDETTMHQNLNLREIMQYIYVIRIYSTYKQIKKKKHCLKFKS